MHKFICVKQCVHGIAFLFCVIWSDSVGFAFNSGPVCELSSTIYTPVIVFNNKSEEFIRGSFKYGPLQKVSRSKVAVRNIYEIGDESHRGRYTHFNTCVMKNHLRYASFYFYYKKLDFLEFFEQKFFYHLIFLSNNAMRVCYTQCMFLQTFQFTFSNSCKRSKILINCIYLFQS